jgi:hypothetical protein
MRPLRRGQISVRLQPDRETERPLLDGMQAAQVVDLGKARRRGIQRREDDAVLQSRQAKLEVELAAVSQDEQAARCAG